MQAISTRRRCRRLNDDYPDIATTPVDVRDEGAIDTWFDDTIDNLDGLDVLVNNAGIKDPPPPSTISTSTAGATAWRSVSIRIFSCRRAVPVMKDQRSGCIINISSTAGLYGCGFRTPYAAAKWAVIGLTKSLAIELGRWNVRVNAICPGAVEGDRMDRVIAAESRSAGRSSGGDPRTIYTKGAVAQPLRATRRRSPTLCLFLASPAAEMISGQAIAVDGNTETFHTE